MARSVARKQKLDRMNEYPVPDTYVQLAASLDVVAATVRRYVDMKPKPWPDSISARELAQQNDFAALPFSHPMKHTQLAPLHYLGSAQDHLTAMAAAIRTPMTVTATLTLLRTVMVGAGYAAYLADPSITAAERVRRTMNCYLESTTEQMRLVGRRDAESQAEYDRLEQRRRDVKSGARQLGWVVAGNETPRQKAWPTEWSIAPKPTEMKLVDELVADVASTERLGHTLYRYLSAATHVQPHALLGLIDRERSVSLGDGSAMASVGMDGRQLCTLVLAAVGGLTVAIDRCVGLYGWPVEPWRQDVVPFFQQVRDELGIPRPTTRVHFSG